MKRGNHPRDLTSCAEVPKSLLGPSSLPGLEQLDLPGESSDRRWISGGYSYLVSIGCAFRTIGVWVSGILSELGSREWGSLGVWFGQPRVGIVSIIRARLMRALDERVVDMSTLHCALVGQCSRVCLVALRFAPFLPWVCVGGPGAMRFLVFPRGCRTGVPRARRP